MRIVFAGTPEIAATVLEKLLATLHEVVGVYTQVDRPRGRGQHLGKSAVKVLAEAHDIAVFQPLSLKDPDAQASLAALNADLMIVVAYGLILPQSVLDIPKLGCWNVHVSLLPRWRGAAPIQRAIEAGDQRSGVCIMQMDAGLDTGPILQVKECEILPEDNAETLHDKLALLGAEALLETLQLLTQGKLKAQAQSADGVTYAKKISKEEAAINWQDEAKSIAHKIQAFNPWPVAQTQVSGEVVRLWQAQFLPHAQAQKPGTIVRVSADGIDVVAKNGLVRIQALQFAGGKVLKVKELINNPHQVMQLGAICQ